MAITGSRFTIERQKLCLWLESEKRKLSLLPAEIKAQRDSDLEREFRNKLDRLYNEMQSKPPAGAAKAKLN